MTRNFWPALSCVLAAATACAVADDTATEAGHPATTDPAVFDAAYPPQMRELSFESHGSKLNGLMYVAAGEGPHPTVVLLHGYAGNERNLDLAQAARRAGVNVMYFNYRGSWGSGGEFSLLNPVEDAATAVAFVRSDDARREYRGDGRVALVGHSFGGFVAAMATAADPEISCLVFLAGAELGPIARLAAADTTIRSEIESALGPDMDYEGGPIKARPDAIIQELIDDTNAFDVSARAARLVDRPILMVAGERDELNPKTEQHDPLIAVLRAAGGRAITELVFDDDHYFSAHRVELSRRLIDWLRQDCWPES